VPISGNSVRFEPRYLITDQSSRISLLDLNG
jgi:hypothetical protein